MTQSEKIELLKNTIKFLYEKEGRSKSYISKLLDVDRKVLTYYINNEWKFIKGNVRYLTPSKQKFLNKNKKKIISLYNDDYNTNEIEKILKVEKGFLRNIDKSDNDIKIAKEMQKETHISAKDIIKNERNEHYKFEDLPGEIWKPIMGYDGYFISNKGRTKKFISSYGCYQLIKPTKNVNNGRLYVKLDGKNLQVSRLVGFGFLDGYSEINNTIDHIDNNKENNSSDNLQWVSQSYNNKLSYDRDNKKSNIANSKNKFKKIILDNKYEFKTIRSLAKFLNKSESQVQRYISGEAKCDHKIKLI